MRSFNKIFCIGLTKTGTNSLTEALNALDIPIRHYPDSEDTFNQIANGFFRIKELETHRGISDIMAATYYPDFDREYPGSLFINTVRNDGLWVDSARKKMRGVERDDRAVQDQRGRARDLPNLLRVATYGTAVWDRERMLYVYDRHLNEARRYFRGRDVYLEMDICAGDGWKKLCEFLRCPVPEIEFPHLVHSGSRQKREAK